MTILRAGNVKPSPGARIDPTHQLGGGVAHWFCNDGSGKQLTDTGSYRNHGTLTNMDPATAWRPGRYGVKLGFDGIDDYVDAGNNAVLDNMAEITILAWIYPEGWGQGSYGRILCKNDISSEQSYEMTLWNGGSEETVLVAFYGDTTSMTLQAPNNTISLNNSYFIAATNANGKQELYVNSVLEDSDTVATGDIADSATNCLIGQRGDGLREFNGLIDGVYIYNRALTADEIAWLYHEPYSMVIAPDPARFFSIPVVEVDELGAAFVQGGHFMEYRAGSVRAA